ncbi:hypothetical protein TWF569_002265 [Orbilia oligospora]|uniref:Uncharacterized protein n=1 Tax=Orbilia oligospora TaxID=2813651 RepID=A0A7C8J2Q4_ORBOL|nr:hypothetical protein TWF706_002486 [Orbilia oligospora]KAF3081651.1 hypothetical protein TWF102_001607 [Orbilia oligospora]KAF3112378.1 hypothetical protein TWF103_003165 [Orbilia oligospora]KAF3122187.1 hypothetical protein TWF569_002265 [Orbilia oligospora]KAF3123754.1 hypothetical protein TWF594_002193 [Orbilia oligospora]
MAQLLNKLTHAGPDAKCYITYGNLPATLGPETLNQRPYTTIRGHVYNQQVDLLLPDEICELVQNRLSEQLKPLQYHRIFMGLKGILEKEFYNHYIRQGNILLLSDGRIDVDDVYCLYDGTLYLFLKKDSYEKAGLVGKQATFGGRKKERWVIELNLREPHMIHGRKAFDRLVWSFTNVFKQQNAWLFCDLQQEAINPSAAPSEPTVKGLTLPTVIRTITPTVTNSSTPIKLASFAHKIPTKDSTEYTRTVFYDWATSLHEWLALVSINADRLNITDSIDPLLSRYEPPTDDDNIITSTTYTSEYELQGKISKISWRGFIPAEYISKIFSIVQEVVARDQWYSITVHGFQNAPISWKGRQHSAVGGGMGGENLYTIFRLLEGNNTSSVGGRNGGDDDDDVMGGMSITQGVNEKIVGSKYIMWEVVGGRDEFS